MINQWNMTGNGPANVERFHHARAVAMSAPALGRKGGGQHLPRRGVCIRTIQPTVSLMPTPVRRSGGSANTRPSTTRSRSDALVGHPFFNDQILSNALVDGDVRSSRLLLSIAAPGLGGEVAARVLGRRPCPPLAAQCGRGRLPGGR
jgi:hypothetical protein